MKKQKLETVVSIGLTLALAAALLTGCGEVSQETVTIEETIVPQAESVPELEEPTADAAEELGDAVGADQGVYEDVNGWSVKYDPSVITVNNGGDISTFVYTGESAGTNMITASYNEGSDAKTAIAELANEWGSAAQTHEAPFPGAEDVTGYWAMLLPSSEGSGLYETALARDYKDGYLLFEVTGHNSGDDSIDIPVSDSLAAIIDSIEFKN